MSLRVVFSNAYRQISEQFSLNPLNNLPFFPDKIPLNLKRCVLKTASSIWRPNVIDFLSIDEAGLEVDFMRIVGKQMNCNVTFSAHAMEDLGLQVFDHEEHTKRLAMLKGEVFDLFFGVIPAIRTVLRDFDWTDCFQQNRMTFIVPRAGIRPSSAVLWTVFERLITLLLIILGSTIILSLIINFMHNFSIQIMTIKPYSVIRIAGTLLRTLIDTSMPTLPQNETIRCIYGTWFAACLILGCYFNTMLISFFTEPGHLEQILTTKQIYESNIPLSINKLYIRSVNMTPLYGEDFVSRNVESSISIGLKLASLGKAVTYTDILRAHHISLQWISHSGESSVFYIDGNYIISLWNFLIMYRGNPLMERINDIMRRINQSGFWDFQMARYYQRRLIRTMIRQHLIVYNYQHNINNSKSINEFNEIFSDTFRMSNNNVTENLLLEFNEEDIVSRFERSEKTLVTWEHLSTVFRLWGFGMIAGLIVFIGEFLCFNCLNWQLNNKC